MGGKCNYYLKLFFSIFLINTLSVSYTPNLKAVAGEGGAVHEVPGLFDAPALAKQEADGGVSLTTGTGVYVYGKLKF